jgi:serine/threonine-protein kinase
MFLDEAKVSLHLNHTNIVQVFDLGIADGTYFIVMEFVDGTNLKKIIQLLGERKQRLPAEQAVYIALEVCKGLSHAHGKRDQEGNHLSIVHRDISPPNVLMSREGEVKITDFGLAKAKSQAEITDPGVVKGKFGYLSPEAANGEDVDARTDIFAAGIVLWEMLAGRRLFLGKSDYDTLKLVQKAEIPPLSKFGRDIPRGLQQILARSLTKDPATRFKSAEEMGRALAGYLFEQGAVVSAFDIAGLVESVLDKKDEKTTAADVAAGQEVQRELNQLMSLEEMGNLDLFMAENFGQIAQDSEASGEYDGDGEDPRDWMDLGFGGEDFSGGFEGGGDSKGAPSGGGSDSWQEGGLQDVARATQSMQAINGPGSKRPKQKTQPQNNQQRGQSGSSTPPAPQRPMPSQDTGDRLVNSSGQPDGSQQSPQQQNQPQNQQQNQQQNQPQPNQPQPNQPQPNQQQQSPQPMQKQTPPVQKDPRQQPQPDKKAIGKVYILLIGLLVLAILGAIAFLLSNSGII